MASTRANPRGHQRIAVSLPDGRLIEYVTDGKGRRIGKMVNGVLTKQWLYRDQLKPVAELDGAGNLVAQFVYGTNPGTPDLVVRSGTTYRIVGDQLGSPVIAVNVSNSSDMPFLATYSAFGERILIAGSDDWVPFGFAGGLYDLDTKMTRFGMRDYDPRFGRWLSKDRVLFRGGQVNLYQYTGGDALNVSDPTGLSVYACQEYQQGSNTYWWLVYGFSHAYLSTDTNTFGLYPTGGWLEFSDANILDDSSSSGVCNEGPDVDEDCVNSYALYGQHWGTYGASNNCGTFVAEVLNACRVASSGSPYPPGGF